MKKYCGKSDIMGHGVTARCGELFYGATHQCTSCIKGGEPPEPRELFSKSYDGESIVGLGRDIHEAFDVLFNPAMAQVTEMKSSPEFLSGKFKLVLTWEPDEETPLGYTEQGNPIYPPEPGRIYSAAVTTCHACNKVISGCGGPHAKALCFDCKEAQSL